MIGGAAIPGGDSPGGAAPAAGLGVRSSSVVVMACPPLDPSCRRLCRRRGGDDDPPRVSARKRGRASPTRLIRQGDKAWQMSPLLLLLFTFRNRRTTFARARRWGWVFG